METKRNDAEYSEKSEKVAERADQLSNRQPPERRERPDLAHAHLSQSGHCSQISAFVTRRWFCTALAAAPLFGARGPVVGVSLKRMPDAALKALADQGIREAEGDNRRDTLALLPKLRQYGINVRSCHVEVPLITNFWDPHPDLKPTSLQEAIDGIAAAGIEFFTLSAIGAGERGDADDFYRRTADRMNAAGDLCRKSKLRFAWQICPLDLEGRPRAIDIYNERVDKKLAPMELDATQVKPDPLLKQWKGHIPMMIVSGTDENLLKSAASAGVEYCWDAPR
jgi:hypothetical protein